MVWAKGFGIDRAGEIIRWLQHRRIAARQQFCGEVMKLVAPLICTVNSEAPSTVAPIHSPDGSSGQNAAILRSVSAARGRGASGDRRNRASRARTIYVGDAAGELQALEPCNGGSGAVGRLSRSGLPFGIRALAMVSAVVSGQALRVVVHGGGTTPQVKADTFSG